MSSGASVVFSGALEVSSSASVVSSGASVVSSGASVLSYRAWTGVMSDANALSCKEAIPTETKANDLSNLEKLRQIMRSTERLLLYERYTQNLLNSITKGRMDSRIT